MTDPQFRYNPLPASSDIRLLEIYPSDSNDAVACNLVIKSLDSDPTYIALSYTWGDTGENRYITCNGIQVEVTRNLHSALHRLRLPKSSHRSASLKLTSRLGQALGRLRSRPAKTPTRMIVDGRRIDPTGDVSDVLANFLPGPLYLWADAICIDQSNVDEKSIQVAMMHRIYRQASLVVADIGDMTENTKYALQTMPGWKSPLNAQMEKMNETDVDLAREKILAGFTELFLQPWFSRVWVFQEVVLAKEVALLCGNNLNPAIVVHGVGQAILELDTDLRYGLHYLEEYQTTKDISARAFAKFQKMIFWNHMLCYESRPEMLDILHTQTDSSATDGKDKIYAFLGVAREFVNHSFKVDYSESTSQTYYRFACHMLVQEKQLRLLHLVTGRPNHFGLPSWVPDFSSRSILQPIGFEKKTVYSAGGIKDPQFQVLKQFRELRVLGAFQDTIAHVGQTWRTSRYLEGPVWTSLVLLFIAAEALDMVQQYCVQPAGMGVVEACWRTLVCNTADGVNRLGPETLHPMQKAFDCLRMVCLEKLIELQKKRGVGWDDLSDDTELEFSVDSRKIARPFLATLDIFSAERRFALTKTGLPAFVPGAAKVGDHVCVFQGMPTPFVIRRYKTGCDLVGAAYVHGMMEGETLSVDRQLDYIAVH